MILIPPMEISLSAAFLSSCRNYFQTHFVDGFSYRLIDYFDFHSPLIFLYYFACGERRRQQSYS